MAEPSGLRDPETAVRRVGAVALVSQAIALLLAIQPIRMLGGDLSGTTIVVVLVLAGVAVGLAALLRHPWAWWAALGLQGALILAGVLHWSLAVLGVVFGLCWVFVLYVRRRLTQ